MRGPTRREDFEATILPHLPAAHAFARRLTRHGSDAEDLAQEAVLKAWRAFEQLEPGTNAKAWLFQILKNTSRNDWRRRASRPDEVSLEHPVGGPTGGEWSLGDLLVGSSDDPEALVEAVLARADVEEALARLPQAFREVVQLCLVEGFRYHEAAAILGVPEGTVMSRLHRGRRQLQETLLERALELGIVPAGGAASSVAA